MKAPEQKYKKTFQIIQDKPWAIHPAKLEEIHIFIQSVANGNPRPDFEAAVKGKDKEPSTEPRFEIRDGVAIIPVYDTLSKRVNMWSNYSGGTSLDLLRKDILSARDNPEVKALLLDVDSPGGTVDGTKEVADLIFSLRGQKPVVAFAGGMMASAAYWIGSAADMVIGFDTSSIGSIGVALTHYDRSAADEEAGIKRTMISAGKYKRIASDEKPLSKEGKAYLQEIADTYYSLFVDSVAKNRNASVDTVLDQMADGREFIGKQALYAGLIDSLGTFDDAFSAAKQLTVKPFQQTNTHKEETIMTLQELIEKTPEIYQQAFDLGAASVEQVDISSVEKSGLEKGVDIERKRVVAILSAGADPAATHAAIEEGLSVDAAYKKFYEAEKAKKADGLKSLAEAATGPVGQIAGETETEKADFMAVVEKKIKDEGKTRAQAIREVAKEKPELHEAYLKSLKSE